MNLILFTRQFKAFLFRKEFLFLKLEYQMDRFIYYKYN